MAPIQLPINLSVNDSCFFSFQAQRSWAKFEKIAAEQFMISEKMEY